MSSGSEATNRRLRTASLATPLIAFLSLAMLCSSVHVSLLSINARLNGSQSSWFPLKSGRSHAFGLSFVGWAVRVAATIASAKFFMSVCWTGCSGCPGSRYSAVFFTQFVTFVDRSNSNSSSYSSSDWTWAISSSVSARVTAAWAAFSSNFCSSSRASSSDLFVDLVDLAVFLSGGGTSVSEDVNGGTAGRSPIIFGRVAATFVLRVLASDDLSCTVCARAVPPDAMRKVDAPSDAGARGADAAAAVERVILPGVGAAGVGTAAATADFGLPAPAVAVDDPVVSVSVETGVFSDQSDVSSDVSPLQDFVFTGEFDRVVGILGFFNPVPKDNVDCMILLVRRFVSSSLLVLRMTRKPYAFLSLDNQNNTFTW